MHMDMCELFLSLVGVFSPEYFALPSEKQCEAYYKLASEQERAYQTFGGFALQQQREQAELLKRYWWAAWWVKWRPAETCARWEWSGVIWQLRISTRE